MAKIGAWTAGLVERESLRPDLNRAVRGTVAFMVPLVVGLSGWLPFHPLHACLAAHAISLVDVRGPYAYRLGLLLGMSVVLTLTVCLGLLGEHSLTLALLGTGLIAAGGGLWRHLSAEYGPGLATSTALMYFLTIAEQPPPPGPWQHPALITLGGALFSTLLQVAAWPFRPQHPLRRSVSETWLALAELCSAMGLDDSARPASLAEREATFRATLNATHANLAAAGRSRGRSGDKLPAHLEALNLAGARLAMRTMVFNTALETAGERGPGREACQPVFESLGNFSRAVALAVVLRQPSQATAFEVRLKRLRSLLAVLRGRIDPAAAGDLQAILDRIDALLPATGEALHGTLERRSGRSALSLELPDLRSMHPLAFEQQSPWRRPDPAIVRHTLRIGVLTALGVLAMKLSHLPHGYWLPFTMVVVLQPDYGSTRLRAAQRVLGTLTGGLIASCLLWLRLPLPALLAVVAVVIALFSYHVKRNYGLAVIFITLMVVLMTEASHPVTLAFTLERSGSTLAGGALAMLAALIFWPVWEARRFPPILIRALQANTTYLETLIGRLREGGLYDDAVVAAKRAAESANSEVFSSLRRMTGDPGNYRGGLEQAATLANGNLRITRALTVIALHLNEQRSRYPAELERFTAISREGFQRLIEAEQTGGALPAGLEEALATLERFRLPAIPADHGDPARFREPWVFPQLSRILTELAAMLISLRSAAAAPTAAGPEAGKAAPQISQTN